MRCFPSWGVLNVRTLKVRIISIFFIVQKVKPDLKKSSPDCSMPDSPPCEVITIKY